MEDLIDDIVYWTSITLFFGCVIFIIGFVIIVILGMIGIL